jgi:hypothetical protein
MRFVGWLIGYVVFGIVMHLVKKGLKLLVIAAIIAALARNASAQTATPTIDPATLKHCVGAIYIPPFGSFGGVCTTGTPGTPSGPAPNIIDVDDNVESDLYASMATAAAIFNKLPEEISKAGPSGQNLTQAMAGAKQVFGYVKWLFSPNSAQELLGRSLAPIGINVLAVFTMIVALTAIYIAINIIVYTVKFIIWVVNQIIKIYHMIMAAINAALNASN